VKSVKTKRDVVKKHGNYIICEMIEVDKKQFDKELELSQKGAEVLKLRIDKIEELEKRIIKLEKKVGGRW